MTTFNFELQLGDQAKEIIGSAPDRTKKLGLPVLTEEAAVVSAFRGGIRALTIEYVERLPPALSVAVRRVKASESSIGPSVYEIAIDEFGMAALRDILIGQAIQHSAFSDAPALSVALTLEELMEHGLFDLARELWGSLYKNLGHIDGVELIGSPGHREMHEVLLPIAKEKKPVTAAARKAA